MSGFTCLVCLSLRETCSISGVDTELERGKNGELVLNGYRILVGKDEKFLRWLVVMTVQECECT